MRRRARNPAGARRPRLATARELRALRSYIEVSLLRDEGDERSVVALAARVREERGRASARRERDAEHRDRAAGDRSARKPPRARRRHRACMFAWLVPSRRYDVFAECLAAAQEQLSERRAAEVLRDRVTPPRPRAGSSPSG